MRLRALSVCFLAGLAIPVLAQRSFVIPHVLEKSGTIVDVGYDFEEGQPTITVDAAGKRLIAIKSCIKVNATQNSQVLRMMKNSINGIPMEKELWTVHRCIPTVRGVGGGRISFYSSNIPEVEFPALDVNASEAGFFECMMDMQETKFDGFFDTSTAEKTAIKSQQKLWLPSNFRVGIGGMPTSRVSKVEAITVRQIATAEGPRYQIAESIVMTIPAEDSGPFMEWYKAALSGEARKPLTIEYQDSDGVACVTLAVDVEIESAYFADVLLGTESTQGREFRIQMRAVNNPGVK